MFPLLFAGRLSPSPLVGEGRGEGGACHSKLPLTTLALCLTRAPGVRPRDSVKRKCPLYQPSPTRGEGAKLGETSALTFPLVGEKLLRRWLSLLLSHAASPARRGICDTSARTRGSACG